MRSTMALLARQMALAVTALTLLFGSYLLHLRLDQIRGNPQNAQQFMLLPKAEFLKVSSLGYHSVLADFFWLQVIQVMGERKVSEEAGRWMYRALDILTSLDPQFVRAYEVGGLALCTLVVFPEESNALLEKGMKHNPHVWQLPFYLGINYYFEFGDDEKAGEYVAKAARLPGAPEYLSGLAARLYVSAKAPQNAVELLASLYEHAADGESRQVLEERLKKAIVARDIQILQEAIKKYRDRFSKQPGRLEDLVSQGVLTALPRDPFGSQYIYDSYAQVVSNSAVKDKMIMRGHRRRG
jgi:tetratricopeptide (TPR) repeat protein